MKTKDKQIPNRNTTTRMRQRSRAALLPFSGFVPASNFQSRTSNFLIAKRKIRKPANPGLFIGLHFPNREKTPFRPSGPFGSLLASAPLRILASLILRPKIRNRRNSLRITNLPFSNLYDPPALSPFARQQQPRPAPPLRRDRPRSAGVLLRLLKRVFVAGRPTLCKFRGCVSLPGKSNLTKWRE